MPTRLVLLRHGESQWNLENRFTGWTDVGLSPKGKREARAAGRLLAKEGYDFDLTFTSYLKRAILTLDLTLEAMDRLWLPVVRHWRLNERHYGALQGLNKAETAARHGDEQVAVWRRSYDIPPPPLSPTTPATRATTRATGTSAPTCSPPPRAWPMWWPACCPSGTTSSCPPCGPGGGCWCRLTATACGPW